MNFRMIGRIMGVIALILAGFMATAVPVSLLMDSGDATALFQGMSVLVVFGLMLFVPFRNANRNIGKREGILIVTGAWVLMSFFGALPYWLSGAIPGFADACFESASGLTTTGATVLDDIEAVSAGILYWRSLTQWIGGMGIIVLTVALFPLLGIGGVELFSAEAPGPKSDRIHPRITETAKRLWYIYLGATGVCAVVLLVCGMTLYEAINHALTTLATGGFSTKNAGAGHFSPLIQYVLTVFMFLAGTNYAVIYLGLKNRWNAVWRSDEFRLYVGLCAGLIVLFTAWIWWRTDTGLEQSFRDSAFTIISLVTTTGFATADYTQWTPGLTLICFLLLFSGACAGSTSGGIKLIRHLSFFKMVEMEMKRVLQRKAIVAVKLNKEIVDPKMLTHILVFLLLYLALYVVGTIIMVGLLGHYDDPLQAAAASVATCLGNVGPAIGEFGPTDNFANVPAAGKLVLVLIMLFGRLEVFTVLVLFTRHFWRW